MTGFPMFLQLAGRTVVFAESTEEIVRNLRQALRCGDPDRGAFYMAVGILSRVRDTLLRAHLSADSKVVTDASTGRATVLHTRLEALGTGGQRVVALALMRQRKHAQEAACPGQYAHGVAI